MSIVTSARRLPLGILTFCAAIFVGLNVAVQAQTSDWGQVEAKAKQEGAVTLYGAIATGVLASIQTEFSKAYGIKVDALEVPAGPQRQRVGMSVNAKQVQVDVLINNDTPFLNQLDQQGELLDLAGLPARAAFPKEWWPGGYPYVATFSQVILVNIDKIDPVSINNWADLLTPKLKGRIVALSPSAGLGVLTYYANMIDSQGADYVKRLGQLNLTIVSTTSEGSQMVASGEKWALLDNISFNTIPLKAKGAPVADVYLHPTSVVAWAAVGLKQAPHPNAAKLLVNWMLSPTGQHAMCGQQQVTCTLPGIAGSLPLPADRKVYDPAEISKRQESIVSLITQSFTK
jgi:iron(III) transport system substrate-binding protein